MWTAAGLTREFFRSIVLSGQVDHDHTHQTIVQRALLNLSSQLTEHLTLEFLVAAEGLAFVAHTVQANEPAHKSTLWSVRVVRRALLDELALVPRIVGLAELEL